MAPHRLCFLVYFVFASIHTLLYIQICILDVMLLKKYTSLEQNLSHGIAETLT